jgi:hypothetical protein
MVNPYGAQHQAIRAALLPHANGVPCCLCGRPMFPSWQALDLDHAPDGSGYRGMAHRACNRRDGAIRGNAARRERTRRPMLSEVAVAVAVSEDWRHASVAAAGRVDGYVGVEILAYLDGTEGVVDEVLAARVTYTVRAVLVDPASTASSLRHPLEAARVRLTLPTAHDVADPAGTFLRLYDQGKLRHRRSAELTAAVRHARQRSLGGAAAWSTRNAPVDMSPLNAASLAAWAVESIPPIPRSKVW